MSPVLSEDQFVSISSPEPTSFQFKENINPAQNSKRSRVEIKNIIPSVKSYLNPLVSPNLVPPVSPILSSKTNPLQIHPAHINYSQFPFQYNQYSQQKISHHPQLGYQSQQYFNQPPQQYFNPHRQQ